MAARWSPALCLLALLALLSLLSLACAYDASCQSKGFTDATQCSQCDKLAEFARDLELIDECNQCCTEDASAGDRSFVKAVLLVNAATLDHYESVGKFLQSYSRDFPKLEVQYVGGLYPRLRMRTAGGEDVSIKMLSWSAEQLRDFLQEKLR